MPARTAPRMTIFLPLPLPVNTGGAPTLDSMPMPQALIVFISRPVPPTAAARYKKSLRVNDLIFVLSICFLTFSPKNSAGRRAALCLPSSNPRAIKACKKKIFLQKNKLVSGVIETRRNAARAIKTMLYRARRRLDRAPVAARRQRFSDGLRGAFNRSWRHTLFVTDELYFSAARGVFFHTGAARMRAASPGLVISKIAGGGDAPWQGMHQHLHSGMHAAGQRGRKVSGWRQHIYGFPCLRFRGRNSAVEIQYREIAI